MGRKRGKIRNRKGESDDGASTCHVRIQLTGKTDNERRDLFQLNIGTSHHTINRRGPLENVREVNIKVATHDESESYCKQILMGTLISSIMGKYSMIAYIAPNIATLSVEKESSHTLYRRKTPPQNWKGARWGSIALVHSRSGQAISRPERTLQMPK